MKRGKTPTLTEASEHPGQAAIAVSCTQLGAGYTASRAKRIIDEWIELLSNPTPLVGLQFTTRTPKRLFAALAGQPRLTRLVVKWGDYADLSPMGSMTQMRHLELRGASVVTDLRPLATLTNLELFALEGFRTIQDPSPLGSMRNVTDLEIGGAWMTPRNGHIANIGFVRELQALEQVLLHTLVVDDLDYSPLLDLPKLRSVRAMKVRGMQPSASRGDERRSSPVVTGRGYRGESGERIVVSFIAQHRAESDASRDQLAW
ncbi:hypothetical protein PZ938_00750 [Luteipulveratus sp. YIM 133132]|uniref:hypothetical protein n=1 Tax=Luteipulveratus flavus TaxID=3031728 RepID=UPI0023B1CCCE|nr:hypothetical protein [Luteipulveratus sp. YIM 133132]MDE9364123.1 hypothetical protein [Luteipulveratus sp. YIM 133132]